MSFSSLLKEFSELDGSDMDLEDLKDVFIYQGFDQESFCKHLMDIEPNKDLFLDNMKAIVFFSNLRGPNLEKQLKKTSVNGKKQLEILINKYSIVNTIADSKDPKVVTAGRILTLFPHLSMNLCDKGYGRDPTNGKGSLAKKFRFMQAPSIIDDRVYNDWLKWAIECDKVINPKSADAKKVETYAQIQRTNSKFQKNKR